jgi:ankyrin repeat protein
MDLKQPSEESKTMSSIDMAKLGLLDLLREYCERQHLGSVSEHLSVLLYYAIVNGREECADYLCSLNGVMCCYDCNEYDCFERNKERSRSENAAINNHMACLRGLHECGFEVHPNTLNCASEAGNLRIVKYLVEVVGCAVTESVAESAAKTGKDDCLSYLISKGCTLSKRLMTAAASNDHLDCMLLLLKNECPYDQSVLEAAAKHGSINCLAHLID